MTVSEIPCFLCTCFKKRRIHERNDLKKEDGVLEIGRGGNSK